MFQNKIIQVSEVDNNWQLASIAHELRIQAFLIRYTLRHTYMLSVHEVKSNIWISSMKIECIADWP